MKPQPTFSESEIQNLKEGYNQFLEGKTISNRQAKKQCKKWLAEKMK
jgi:hypothetical protein